MARPKKELVSDSEEVKIVAEEVKEETRPLVFNDSLIYESVGNIKYDIPKSVSSIDLKAQVPFRMNGGDARLVSTGLKLEIPEGCIGLIVSAGDISVKNQTGILGGTQVVLPGEMKEIFITLKMFGPGFKVFNMGDTMATLIILPASFIPAIQKK